MLKFSGIQLIGTQRSGTNLLRLILNQFDEISAPHPPHILKSFVPLLKNYGDLRTDDNFRRLIEDVVEWVEANPVSWNCKFSVDTLFKRCKKRTIYDLFKVIYEQKRELDQAKIWCCKSTFNVHYYNLLEDNGVKPLYIHLYRDGRDVALSFKKAPVGPKHIYNIANHWKMDQEAALKLSKMVDDKRYIAISYEKLINSPREVIKNLCDRIGLVYNDNALEFYSSKESKITAKAGEMWANVKNPIISNNTGKFRSQMTQYDLELFEKIAGSMLNGLGYECLSSCSLEKAKFSSKKLAEFNVLNGEMIKAAKRNVSPNESIIDKERNLLLAKFTSKEFA